MENDFQPIVGHGSIFALRRCHTGTTSSTASTGVEPNHRLSYSWNASGEEAAGGLKTVVTWTLTPTKGGGLVRMEQSGFRPEDEANCQGANYGWQRYIGGRERMAAGPG